MASISMIMIQDIACDMPRILATSGDTSNHENIMIKKPGSQNDRRGLKRTIHNHWDTIIGTPLLRTPNGESEYLITMFIAMFLIASCLY